MQMTQINTRIPVELKAGGDEVLARFGKSTSDVVRSVWAYMVQHQNLPDCASDAPAAASEVEKRVEHIQQSSKMVQDFLEQRGLPAPCGIDYKSLHEAMYEDMLDEYEALDD